MNNINGSKVKNEFLLHLKSHNIQKLDQAFIGLINGKEFDAAIISKKIFKEENKIAYLVRISAASLIHFKKKLDAIITYESLQLFEFKEW
jgi:hypothetical protein